MNELTDKQAQVLQFIEEYQWEHGSSPTVREMREKFGLSSDNSILKHIKALVKKGYIEKDDTPRGIKLLDNVKQGLEMAADIVRIPLLGTIPAGGAVAAEENVLGTFEMGSGLMRMEGGCFMLQVTGSSMIDAGIFEGDMVLVNPKQLARHGDIVVGLVDGENTVKRYINDKGRIYLKAENPEYEDIYPLSELEVQGVVVGLIRNY
jgi:repressor LexA